MPVRLSVAIAASEHSAAVQVPIAGWSGRAASAIATAKVMNQPATDGSEYRPLARGSAARNAGV